MSVSSMPEQIPRVISSQQHAYEVSRDCDCACGDPFEVYSATTPLNVYHTLRLAPGLQKWSLDREYDVFWLATSDGIPGNIAVLNHAAQEVLAALNQPDAHDDWLTHYQQHWGEQTVANTLSRLMDLRFVVDPTVPTAMICAAQEQLRTLNAWLHVTDRCNLRCVYCYLPHTADDMSNEIGYASIDALLCTALSHHYPEIKLKYAGGEPLLRFPFICNLHQYARDQAARYKLWLDGVILSNGTLVTPQILAAMQTLGLRLMISIDGVGEGHNAQRPFAGGQGSVAVVKRAVELAKKHDIFPDICITITSQNLDAVPDMMRWVLDHDLPFSLNFYRDNMFATRHKGLGLHADRLIEGMLHIYETIEEQLPRRSLLASLLDRANLSVPHRSTCGVGHNYLVFDYRGGVSKCQMQMGTPVANVYDHDLLLRVRADTHGIRNVPVEEKEGCRDCAWKYWCAGGCPLQTYRATGRYDVKSPYCTVYKRLYPEIIRLEGLRLLKYAE